MHRTIITMENSKNVLAFIIGIMSKFVWNMNTMILQCETKFNELYNTNSLVRRPTDWVCRIRDTIYNYFDKSLKEPPYECWSGLYQITNNKLTYSYHIKDLEGIQGFKLSSKLRKLDQELSYPEFIEGIATISIYKDPDPYVPLKQKIETFLEQDIL